MTQAQEEELTESEKIQQEFEKFEIRTRARHAQQYRPPSAAMIAEHLKDHMNCDPTEDRHNDLDQTDRSCCEDEPTTIEHDSPASLNVETNNSLDMHTRSLTEQASLGTDTSLERITRAIRSGEQQVPKSISRFLNRLKSSFGEEVMARRSQKLKEKMSKLKSSTASVEEENIDHLQPPTVSESRSRSLPVDKSRNQPQRPIQADHGTGRVTPRSSQRTRTRPAGDVKQISAPGSSRNRERKQMMNSVLGRGRLFNSGKEKPAVVSPAAAASHRAAYKKYEGNLQLLDDLEVDKENNRLLQNWIRFHCDGGATDEVSHNLSKLADFFGGRSRSRSQTSDNTVDPDVTSEEKPDVASHDCSGQDDPMVEGKELVGFGEDNFLSSHRFLHDGDSHSENKGPLNIEYSKMVPESSEDSFEFFAEDGGTTEDQFEDNGVSNEFETWEVSDLSELKVNADQDFVETFQHGSL